jgi:hypothetical protein
VKQGRHEVRRDKGSDSSRTLALDEQLVSELEGFLSELNKMAFWLDFSPKTLTDYVRLFRKALSARARVAPGTRNTLRKW